MISSLISASRARSIAPPPSIIPPPTNGIVDNENKTFDFTLADGYEDLSDYEYTVTGGEPWLKLESKPIFVGNKDIDNGYIAVRTIDVIKEKYSIILCNEIPFTYTIPIKSTVPAPTGVTGNITDRTFSFTIASGLTIADYEFCRRYQDTRVWVDVESNPQPLINQWSMPINTVGLRVKETDSRWASEVSTVPVDYPLRNNPGPHVEVKIDTDLRLLWAQSPFGALYSRLRISSGAFNSVAYPIDIGNVNRDASYYDVRYDAGREVNGALSPVYESPALSKRTYNSDAPTLTANDINNTLMAWHPLGDSEILVSINNGTYIAYSGIISVGNVSIADGYYKFKTRALGDRVESPVVNSPAFTIDTIGETFPYTLTLELA